MAETLNQITAVVLAGGLGSRLRSEVADRPKVIATVGGRPFLSFLLDQIAAAGIRRAVLCTGFRGEQVRDVLGESHGPLSLEYSQESRPLGTGGAVRLALGLVPGDTILVMNGDSYCDASLREFWQSHSERHARASILLARVADTSRFGSVTLNDEGSVIRFDEKGAAGGRGWINAGVYLLERSLVESVKPDAVVSLEREVFPEWIGSGFFGWCPESEFIDIGTPESFRRAQEQFAART